jgi:hypothetical protein
MHVIIIKLWKFFFDKKYGLMANLIKAQRKGIGWHGYKAALSRKGRGIPHRAPAWEWRVLGIFLTPNGRSIE